MPKQYTTTFVENFRVSKEGLRQSSIREIHYSNDQHGPTKIHVTTTLPMFVFPHHWQEFGFCKKDVYKLSEFLPAKLLWLACLVSGSDIQAGCLKPSFARVDEVLISCRLQAINTLLDLHAIPFVKKDSVLETTSPESSHHKPPLSCHDVDHDEYASIIEFLHPKLRAFHVNKIRGLCKWRTKHYLPIQLEGNEGNTVCLQRAVNYKTYEKSGKRKKYGCATLPFVVQTPDKRLFALCEECVLVSPRNG